MYQTHYVPARTNHLLHAFLTFFTVGLWFPVWFVMWLYNHNRTVARQTWVDYPPQMMNYGYPQGQAPVYPPNTP